MNEAFQQMGDALTIFWRNQKGDNSIVVGRRTVSRREVFQKLFARRTIALTEEEADAISACFVRLQRVDAPPTVNGFLTPPKRRSAGATVSSSSAAAAAAAAATA